MSLRRGKVLLEEPAIKRRSKTSPIPPTPESTPPSSVPTTPASSSVPTTPASFDDEAEPHAEPEALRPDRQITGSDIILTEFLSNFRQAIVDGYKDDS